MPQGRGAADGARRDGRRRARGGAGPEGREARAVVSEASRRGVKRTNPSPDLRPSSVRPLRPPNPSPPQLPDGCRGAGASSPRAGRRIESAHTRARSPGPRSSRARSVRPAEVANILDTSGGRSACLLQLPAPRRGGAPPGIWTWPSCTGSKASTPPCRRRTRSLPPVRGLRLFGFLSGVLSGVRRSQTEVCQVPGRKGGPGRPGGVRVRGAGMSYA